jgi:hypothetical protein
MADLGMDAAGGWVAGGLVGPIPGEPEAIPGRPATGNGIGAPTRGNGDRETCDPFGECEVRFRDVGFAKRRRLGMGE